MTAVPPSSAVVERLRAAGCVFAEEEAELLGTAAGTPADLAALVDRRVAGLPLEQVLGWAEFCGLRIVVEPGVFVPRRRTGLLVRQAAALAPPHPVVVDLCCGTGAVGAVLAATLADVELYAADIDPAAVRCARRNIPPGVGRVLEGDLDAPLPSFLLGRVDVLVANAPYVPTDAIATMPPEARDHEARVALDGGADGLDVQRRVAAAAPRWLAAGGSLLIETSERQAPATAAAMTAAGLVTRVARSAELDGTVVIGTRPGRQGGDEPAVGRAAGRGATRPATSPRRVPPPGVPTGRRSADKQHVTRQDLSQGSPRSPRWFDPAHQADISAALDSHLAAGVPERGPFSPRPERVRELAELAAASTLPARAALLRWGALPASVRSHLLTSWFGTAVRRSSAA